MKTSLLRPFQFLAGFLCLPLLLAAADEKTSPPKPYVLFMGANLSVQHDKKVYPVEDVTGSALKIRVDREEVLVPTRPGPVALQVNAGLKLAATSVQLDQLQSGPAYTHENDPMRKLEEASNSAMDVAHAQDLSQAQMVRDIDYQAKAGIALAGSSHPEEVAKNQADVDAGQTRLDKSTKQVLDLALVSTGERTNVGEGALRMKGAEGNYDAMEVSFRISSPVELVHPYMVVLFKFHAPTEKPGVDGLVIHAEALDLVDANPRYVRVFKGGLPIGFKMVECAVHIYNNGVEVATNVSPKRVEMTHDETRQYLVMEHLGAHKGATLPAAGVSGWLPREQRRALSPEELKRRLYVKVSKDGLPLTTYTDEGCTIVLDDARAAAALGEAFFTPALEQGKPVDGVARVRLGDL